MTIYGYCRISTKQQSIERQIRNIKSKYPSAVIVAETFTGTKMDRPKWNNLLKRIQKGDLIVFDSVSRMSRNADEGFQTYESLFNRGIELVFLKEPHIDTEIYKKAMENNLKMTGTAVDLILDGVNLYLLSLAKEQILLSFLQSEKEVMDLRQRTKEGIETARLNGKQIGLKSGRKLKTKKSLEGKREILKHSKHFNGTLNDRECLRLTGLSRNTFYRYKKELREEKKE